MSDVNDHSRGTRMDATQNLTLRQLLQEFLQLQQRAVELQEQTVAAIQAIRLESRPTPAPLDTKELEQRAMVLASYQAAEHGSVNVTALAEELNTNTKRLYRIKPFARLIAQLRQQVKRASPRPRRGFRRDDGSIEAIDG